MSYNIKSGAMTASTIAGFDASTNLITLATATYPSLTELSYVKGVTSAIQTQIDGKQASGSYITSGGALGTPSSGTLTSCTGLPISTGVSGLGTGVATFLATPSSANLAAALTDETGSGAAVFATSPTLVTPTLGIASASNITVTSSTIAANGIYLPSANALGLSTNSTLAATIDSSQRVNIGYGTNIASGPSSNQQSYLQVTSTGTTTNASHMFQYVNDSSSFNMRMHKSRATSPGSFAAVTSGDSMAVFTGRGDDGTKFVNSARIAAVVDAAVSTGIVPGRWDFLTNNASGTETQAMRLDSSQNLSIGTTAGSARLHVVKTTEQVRIGYDTSNYLSTTISSTGSATLSLTGTTPTYTISQTLVAGATVRLKGYTVATLPAGTIGDTAYVTDALAPTFLAVLVGGGAIVTTCFYNGTNWVAQ